MSEISPADLVSILSADEKEESTNSEIKSEQASVDEQPPIMDLVELGKAFRALANARSRIDEIERTATSEKERIEHWRQQVTEADRRTVTYFEGLIGAYALSRREGSKGHDKSLTTPYGLVSSQAQQPEFIRDDAALLPWAKAHGYIKTSTVETIDWTRIKKDGERQLGGAFVTPAGVVPGVVVRDREPKVEIRAW